LEEHFITRKRRNRGSALAELDDGGADPSRDFQEARA
jgi:hypothetical protein